MILGDNESRFIKYRLPVRLFAETAEDKANWTRHKNIKYVPRSVYAENILLFVKMYKNQADEMNFKKFHRDIEYKKKCTQVSYLVTRRKLMSGNQNHISDNVLIDFYQSMIDNGKVRPDGAAFKRMMFLKKRFINKRYQAYKKFVTGSKSSNGAV